MPLPDVWTSRLIAIAAAQAQDDGAHDLNHLHRVWHLARQLLASHTDADALDVQAACYLHDLVNLPKNHPECAQASRMAARLAQALLAQDGLRADQLRAVANSMESQS